MGHQVKKNVCHTSLLTGVQSHSPTRKETSSPKSSDLHKAYSLTPVHSLTHTITTFKKQNQKKLMLKNACTFFYYEIIRPLSGTDVVHQVLPQNSKNKELRLHCVHKESITWTYFTLCTWVFCLHVCLCTTCVSGTQKPRGHRHLWATIEVAETEPSPPQKHPVHS